MFKVEEENKDGVYEEHVEKIYLYKKRLAEQKIQEKKLQIRADSRKNSKGVPDEQVMNNIQKYGNTTAATIPILLAEAEREGRLKRGMKVATVAFGSGFTWGSAIVDW